MTVPMDVNLVVNGQSRSVTIEPRRTLVDVLRGDLGLTGTHVGCEHGACGACTVLVDGRPVRSCLVFAVQADGASIGTVEQLGAPDALNPLQTAMWDNHSFQCGFCTPGFLMQATDLLRRNPWATEEDVRLVLSGNICRCTGYESIIDGVLSALADARAASGASAASIEEATVSPDLDVVVEVAEDWHTARSVVETSSAIADVARLLASAPGATVHVEGGNGLIGAVRLGAEPQVAYEGGLKVSTSPDDPWRSLVRGEATDHAGRRLAVSLVVVLHGDASGTDVELHGQIGLDIPSVEVRPEMLRVAIRQIVGKVLGTERALDASDAAAPEVGRRQIVQSRPAEPIDLLATAGQSLTKRLVPVVGLAAVAFVLLRRRRNRS